MRVDIQEKVYRLVQQIPKGKVTTYGRIGKILHMSPRVIGSALHCNKSAEVPCHRVVNRDGRVAPTFGFGGAVEHRRRLEEEGVTFQDERHVDLTKHLYAFTDQH